MNGEKMLPSNMYNVSNKNTFDLLKLGNTIFHLYIKLQTHKIYNYIHVMKLTRFDRITVDTVKLIFFPVNIPQGGGNKGHVYVPSLLLGM